MIVIQKYEDIVLLVKDKGDYSVDLRKLNSEDYIKAIDFISRFKGLVKRISRCKFSFSYK